MRNSDIESAMERITKMEIKEDIYTIAESGTYKCCVKSNMEI